MASSGVTGYCSERCLNWEFFGVPALKRDDFIAEIRRNQERQTAPKGWTPPPAYPGFGERFRKEVTEGIALVLKTRQDIEADV